MSLELLGGMLVSVSVEDITAAQLADELRAIHDEFIRNRDAEQGYFRMGFVAAKAIERCRQLEGSDGDGMDGRRGVVPRAGVPGDPVAREADRAPQGQPGAPGAPGSAPPRSA
jgi:hypothetical protein